jgi:hypothetical protein
VRVGDEQVPGGELAHRAEHRPRGEHGAARQVLLQRGRVEAAGQVGQREERLQLGREREPPVVERVDERLDPERVAGEDEPAARAVPQREREHPAQPGDEARPALLVQVDDDLRVAARAQPVPAPGQLVAQPPEAVDLAVADRAHVARLVDDGLVAAGGVDEREAPHRQRDRAVLQLARAVGSPVGQGRGHRTRRGQVPGRPVAPQLARDAAHALRLPPARGSRPTRRTCGCRRAAGTRAAGSAGAGRRRSAPRRRRARGAARSGARR